MTGRLRQFFLRLRPSSRREQLNRGHATEGPALGIVAAVFAGQLVGSLLFGVSADDPLSFATAALGVAIAAVIASYILARKATQVDPVVTLRYQ